ncbi:MAG: IS4 family transposase, partial [Rhodospirillales bacterium]|nr:IS4 family transposase [Rhodospirillales bacterium]
MDSTRFSGASYRGANWQCVGQTQGRGRQDRDKQAGETIKDIYVYVLVEDFRRQMGLPDDAGSVAIEPAQGLDAETWAHNEFGAAALGDQRRTQRLVQAAQAKGEKPGCSWPAAVEGNAAATKGYYRLIDQPEHGEVNMSNILQTHRERTVQRIKAQKCVLCIQDSTDLDYSDLVQCEGLGVIGKNQTSTQSKGLRLHSTLAVTDSGLPLGVLHGQCDARALKPEHQGRARSIPLEQKETFRWIQGHRNVVEISKRLPGVRLISVMDREGDFFDFFDQWRQDRRVDVLVRAKHDRHTTEGTRLFEAVKSQRPQARLKVAVARRSARRKKGRRAQRPARPARPAEVAVRYRHVEIRPPRCGLNRHKDPMGLWIIHVVEENPPAGAQNPIEWFLLTTVDIDSVDTATQCVGWYGLRWRIEDWHRVLKSGCRIEDAAHRTAQRLRR